MIKTTDKYVGRPIKIKKKTQIANRKNKRWAIITNQ